MKRRSKKQVMIQIRDWRLLGYLWLWKVATTATLKRKFFEEGSHESCYRRLRKLETAGYIERNCEERGLLFYWALTKKGFKAIRDALPPLQEEGYRSESPRHDLLTSAFHQGDWLVDRPKDIELFTEQQLRRYAPESRPSWANISDEHRPDGLWRVENGGNGHTVALEFELNLKKYARYRAIGSYYSDTHHIGEVIWVLPSKSAAGPLSRNLSVGHSTSENLYSYILIEDFLAYGWGAKFFAGKRQGLSVHQLWCSKGVQKVFKGRSNLNTRALLDGRITSLGIDTYAMC